MNIDDLTNGQSYFLPLNTPCDIAHNFGFIYENNPYLIHSGIDCRAKKGTPVRSINNGRVILVAKMFRREGNMVIVCHGLGVCSVYMHLSKFGQVEEIRKLKNGKVKKPKNWLNLPIINSLIYMPVKMILFL